MKLIKSLENAKPITNKLIPNLKSKLLKKTTCSKKSYKMHIYIVLCCLIFGKELL